MRGKDATQFSIAIETKNKLDRLKVEKKDEIIRRYKLKRRMITNTLIIQYLLDEHLIGALKGLKGKKRGG